MSAGEYTADIGKFIRDYGCASRHGRPDRLDFTGRHRLNERSEKTGLMLVLEGFSFTDSRIVDADGGIVLITKNDNVAAKWPFSTLLEHWNRKHNKAAYVLCVKRDDPRLQYCFGNNILLCEDTRFDLFLRAMTTNTIYYDPGCKLENVSTERPRAKRRNQFRIKWPDIIKLYKNYEWVDLLAAEDDTLQ